MKEFFDRVTIINLERRTDRLAEIKIELAKGWPFSRPLVMKAVDGRTAKPPATFQHGGNVWACGQSHLKAVREALMNGMKSLLVMEDDCGLCDDFHVKAVQFVERLPSDWEICWFGGEHRQPPMPVKPGIVRNVSTDRLHCYGLSLSGMQKIEKLWRNWQDGHCDWLLNAHLTEFNTYAPDGAWLACQRGGFSDLMNVDKSREWFNEIKPCDGVTAVEKKLLSAKPFAKAFVISLPFHQDRLRTFLENVPKIFGDIAVWPAVWGDRLQIPDWWKSGHAAWGCYRAHLSLLERCYSDDVESYVVFEDDAIFRPDTEQRLATFLADTPEWDQLYLGGQLLEENEHPPQKITRHCLKPWNVNRTHTFAVHRRGYSKIYQHLLKTPFNEAEHLDHHLGRLHFSGDFNVFVPGRWLTGQAAGQSSINGNMQPEQFWPDPIDVFHLSEANPHRQRIPLVWLDSSVEVAVALESKGWHRGYWKDGRNLDHGVSEALSTPDPADSLKGWYQAVVVEARRDGKQCICLYHPDLTEIIVAQIRFAIVTTIKAASANEAEKIFSAWRPALTAENSLVRPGDDNENSISARLT